MAENSDAMSNQAHAELSAFVFDYILLAKLAEETDAAKVLGRVDHVLDLVEVFKRTLKEIDFDGKIMMAQVLCILKIETNAFLLERKISSKDLYGELKNNKSSREKLNTLVKKLFDKEGGYWTKLVDMVFENKEWMNSHMDEILLLEKGTFDRDRDMKREDVHAVIVFWFVSTVDIGKLTLIDHMDQTKWAMLMGQTKPLDPNGKRSMTANARQAKVEKGSSVRKDDKESGSESKEVRDKLKEFEENFGAKCLCGDSKCKKSFASYTKDKEKREKPNHAIKVLCKTRSKEWTDPAQFFDTWKAAKLAGIKPDKLRGVVRK